MRCIAAPHTPPAMHRAGMGKYFPMAIVATHGASWSSNFCQNGRSWIRCRSPWLELTTCSGDQNSHLKGLVTKINPERPNTVKMQMPYLQGVTFFDGRVWS